MKMQTDPTSIQLLFAKYTRGEASVEETAYLFKLIGENNHDGDLNSLLESELDDTEFAAQYNPAWEVTLTKIKQQVCETPATHAQKRTIKLWPRLAAAVVAAVVLITFGMYFLTSKQDNAADYTHLTSNDIPPGKIGATLTLADGKKISLSNAANGEIAKEAGISISKTADGQVVYKIQANESNTSKFNTLTTAIGETYILTLPDQTKVWLNAASSLTYNTAVIANGLRKVKLTGEAYFEVAKDKAHPFIVESGTQQVEVLGTHFNVNAYQDEKVSRTTLLEGSVKITDQGEPRILIPGTQAANVEGNIKLNQVDTDLAVAWINNNFVFDRRDIKEIMRMIARWYNVEIIYKEEIPIGTVWGSVSRFDNISKVLIPLEATGNVHFEIKGRKVYVSR